ncbi:MAG TPA: DUF2510 domain-containing protein [Solirubrobacterales bacterium]|nr:DUF2510 domain-containing protein [Solirubrobacterales bacterium]
MEDPTQANEPESTPEPPAPDPGPADPAQPSTPSPGWYPDPNAGGANLMRYWDGATWTDQVHGGSEVSTTRRTDDERKVLLAQQLQTAAARGLRIESQSDFQAVLVEGKPVNHVLHAILTIFTCLLWGIVWAIIAATGGEKRQMVVVDEFGNVLWQNLGSA